MVSHSYKNPPESPIATEVRHKICAALPDAKVEITDPDGVHLAATVISAQFSGKSKLAQHRMVYAALGDAFEERLHALQLTTRAS
ncbi:MAG: BolA family transcriptional regulator [Proteobacteria bacterium]|nr:BolA family transcriptional regulator [Pseudomonadota bacterium]NBX86758.1 BolA family transcriptional regulator [Pseudomonadota bacterium]